MPLLRLILWLLACTLGSWLLLRGGPPMPGNEDGRKAKTGAHAEADVIDLSAQRTQLRAANPEFVGIGNSMMFTRLGMTPEAISRLTGRRFHFIYKPGSDAPVWYLLMKNVVAASEMHPKAIFLFVRDNELTAPYGGRPSVSNAYWKSLHAPEDPNVQLFMKRGQAGKTSGVVDQWLDDTLAIPEWREQMTRRVADTAMDLVGGASKKAQHMALSARFNLNHLRGDLVTGLPQTDAADLASAGYAESFQASLLPDMLRTAEACGAKLFVFRIKRRPDARTNLPEEPAAMKEYADALRQWLGQRGAMFFDETYDQSIHLSDYLDGDHISPERLDWYREYFWQRVRDTLSHS